MAIPAPVPSSVNQSATPIRVMLVDDSSTVRMLTKRWLDDEEGVNVVASCRNGLEALQNLRRNRIEVVVLDIEMPEMDGVKALPEIFKISPNVKVVMSSTLTKRNADISMRCLELGAADYIPKPSNGPDLANAKNFRRELIEKIRTLGKVARLKSRPGAGIGGGARARAARGGRANVRLREASKSRPKIIAIGSSTGGPNALIELFQGLDPRSLPPVVVVQHMPPTFTSVLAQHISKKTAFSCKEAEEGMILVPGQVYLAPGDHHMVVVAEGASRRIAINQDPPVNFCRPAVDPLFRSVAGAYGRSALAIVLTGMGHDGTEGGADIANAGGTVIAQNEETSVVWGMPGAAANAGICHDVLPLQKIADKVKSLCGAH